jgi:glycosyltransferase involved in cell wall biosynthesis
MNPVISVILPVFNCENYIASAVRSILDQTFREFEFIIIDDGSTDGTPEILRSLGEIDSRISILTIPNGGHTKAILTGLARSTGEFIARMDGDDVSSPLRFEAQINFLRANPLCGVVGTAIGIIDEDGDLISHRKFPTTHSEIDSEHILRGMCSLAHPSTMIRRSSLEAAGNYRPEFEPAEDFNLWIRLAEVSLLANLDTELVNYRVHCKSTTSTRLNEMVCSVNRSLVEAWARRNLGPFSGPEISAPPTLDQIAAIRGFACVAWESGFYKTSRKHAWRQFRMAPFRVRSWKYLIRCLLGPVSRPIVKFGLTLRRYLETRDRVSP